MNDLEIVTWIIDVLEQGAISHVSPHDLGKRTHWGVTKVAYAEHHNLRLQDVTDAQIDALTHSDAEILWLDLFIMRTNFFQIQDWRLRLLLAQFAGNAGPKAAAKALQHAAGVQVDGIVGQETLWAVARLDAIGQARVFRLIVAGQLRHYRAVIRAHPDQVANAAGWCFRVAQTLEAA